MFNFDRKMIEETIKKFYSLDLLVRNSSFHLIFHNDSPIQVLNAGRGCLVPVEMVKNDDFEFMKRLTEINYYGCVYPTVYALPHLKSAKGSIAVVSSLSCEKIHRNR